MKKLTEGLQDMEWSIRNDDAVWGVIRSCSGHRLQESWSWDRVEDQWLGVLPYQPQLVRLAPHVHKVGNNVPLVIISIPQSDKRATTLNRVRIMISIMILHTCISAMWATLNSIRDLCNLKCSPLFYMITAKLHISKETKLSRRIMQVRQSWNYYPGLVIWLYCVTFFAVQICSGNCRSALQNCRSQ